MIYWATLRIHACSQAEAESLAKAMTVTYGGSIIEVQREPPQGATIVGDMHEDNL